MATEKQIKANRKNSQKSTGPKTAGGKAAVSQDAVKHGLFADSVVTGETEAEYEAFQGELLAELAPRGVVELLLAERVVSLWWRLIRAERMQNQAIEEMIECDVTNPSAIRSRERHCCKQGIQPDDPRFEPEHLALGRIATIDWSNCKVLDRMLLYERRIESSLNRVMRELQRIQKIRRIEQRDTRQKKAASAHAIPKAFGFEAATRSMHSAEYSDLKKQSQYDRSAFGVPGAAMNDLKKQSQFAMDDIITSTLKQIGYGDIPAGGNEENKANSPELSMPTRNWRTSKSQFDAPGPAAGTPEGEKSVKEAGG